MVKVKKIYKIKKCPSRISIEIIKRRNKTYFINDKLHFIV